MCYYLLLPSHMFDGAYRLLHGMNSEFMGTAVRSLSALAWLPVRASRESR